MDGRRGAGKVIDLVNFNFDRIDNIMSPEFKIRITHDRFDILFSTGKVIIESNHFIAIAEQSRAEMTS